MLVRPSRSWMCFQTWERSMLEELGGFRSEKEMLSLPVRHAFISSSASHLSLAA